MLYQYLDIKDNEKKQLSKLIFNKQNIILILIAILFSPMVIGVRFICCKIDKIENRKIKAVIKVIGFVVFSSYLVSLKENVAYLLIGIFSLVYLLYQFYLSGLETKWQDSGNHAFQRDFLQYHHPEHCTDESGSLVIITIIRILDREKYWYMNRLFGYCEKLWFMKTKCKSKTVWQNFIW